MDDEALEEKKKIDEIIDTVKMYHPDADCTVIEKAYLFAKEAHDGQKRLSGEDFINHPIEIARILSNLQLDETTVSAGLLHDVVEDTSISLDDIREGFSDEIASLVDGVTKINKIKVSGEDEEQIETFRKMFVAMANDVRVIIVKLADRLHNMRTLAAMTREKQIKKSRETLDIYAPISSRLGIYRIKWELEDLAFKFLEPESYAEVVELVASEREEREEYIRGVIEILSEKLTSENIQHEISGRPKHYYSIYQKMESGKGIDEIYDLMAIRVIVNKIDDCYATLGWAHTLWKPIPGRIKDYIAMPKANMYQSLHTTVMGPGGKPFEIQIRTVEMHMIAEYGVAAHWRYKEGKAGPDGLSEKLNGLMNEIKELEQDSEDSGDFVESVKTDLYDDEVFIFTPKGKLIELPAGATPIDFAYRIHTDVGNSCVGSKVNGKIVPLTYKLQNGDRVEILTNTSSKGPSRDWLNVVVSPQARNKIRAFFRKADKEENILKGRELFKRECKHLKTEITEDMKLRYEDFIRSRFNVASWDDLYATIGYGGVKAGYVIQRIKANFTHDFAEESDRPALVKAPTKGKGASVHVQGHSDLEVTFANCCKPVPGDQIVGFTTRGRGITVHRADCVNIANTNEPDRIIAVNWITENVQSDSFTANLMIRCLDRKGLIADVSTIIGNEGINISSFRTAASGEDEIRMNIEIVISSVSQVQSLVNKLGSVPSVLAVYRI
ncbi:MAG: bifunctional (p)ppGpp synthetase/guanosine-3',5'-bis(diphosphate) 3'-pyrophosphohydrolase [Eubacteriaceae bacterium]|nr:bifunctional (p)ppGpp synthetase/guanosine-3',5'-bis(diphosphate) 3'-pyrophosphohydrolase [Eubacteriaceae bacterium]